MYPDVHDRNRVKKIMVECPSGNCPRGISKPPSNDQYEGKTKYGIMQEVESGVEEWRNFQDWILDFDSKIHQVIFHYHTEFNVSGRPGQKPSLQDVENKWNWTHRGRKSDPNPLYHRFAIEYDEIETPEGSDDQVGVHE